MKWRKVTMIRQTNGLIKSIGQSVLSLSFNLGGMLAGTLLVFYLDVFSITSWAFLLFPGVLSIRGAIGGLFSGRLSTALHVGTVKASFSRNTKSFYLLLNAIITLTFVSSVVMGLVTSLFSAFIYGINAVDCIAILAVIVTTMGLSLIFISPITLGVSILSFKRGLDPDVIVYPVISTVADVLVTICYILVLDRFFVFQRVLMGLISLIFLLVVCYILIKNNKESEFVKTVREFLFTLVLVAFIVNLTGSILDKISHVIGGKKEVYVVYPALIDTVGAVGSIVGSTTTTKLSLGIIAPSFSSIKLHLIEIGSAWFASLIMFSSFAIIATFIHGSIASIDFLWFLVQLIIANVIAVGFIVVASFVVAISTQRRGWDPDNFVIPIESSLADGITTISLLTAILLTT